MRGEAHPLSSSAYTFEEGALEERTAGENLLEENLVETETPATTLKLWNQDAKVPLLVVSQDRHCLARLGTAKVKQDFQACIKSSQNGEPGHRCKAFCHIDPKERYGFPVVPNLEYLAIQTRVEGNLQNPSVFFRPLLAVSSM